MIGLIKVLRKAGHGVGVVALRGLKIIRDWVFVPRYKNDLGKHVSLDILPVSSRKIYPQPTLSKQKK